MLILAVWILEQQNKAISWLVDEEKSRPVDVFAFRLVMAAMTAPLWGMAMVQPYYQLYSLHSATSWAVKDITYSAGVQAKYGKTAAKYRTLTHWNYFPRTRAFAMRGGVRWAATRVGSKLIPVVGWALFVLDLWMLGTWIGEKTWGAVAVPEES